MFHDFINLFYPRLCQICDSSLIRSETVLCLKCIHQLPVTNFHLQNENPVKKVFYGRVLVENATALLHFRKKSAVQKLIHQLKYRGHKEIGIYLGKWMGKELTESSEFKGIDMVIPVPLHRKKLRSRGYNQVEGFGKEIAAALQIPYEDQVLLKKTYSSTQTIKIRLARWGSIEETFVLANSEKIRNKHILLVDDLITTGATLEACSNILQHSPGVKISIASMAIA
ncbi:MAG: ComF family protein [Bacteroidota bacterium]